MIKGISIDVETTGDTPGVHEIVQIGAVPFNEEFEPMGRFVSYVRPMHPELAMKEAMEVNHLEMSELLKAPTPAQVRSSFMEWKREYVGEGQMIPLGHNYGLFDGWLMTLFFTKPLYSKMFSYRYIDTCVVGRYLVDSRKISLERFGFSSLCEHFGIVNKCQHDAYEDALCTLRLYKKMLTA